MPWIKQDLTDEDRPARSESRQGRLFNNHDRLNGKANEPSVWNNSNHELPKTRLSSPDNKPAKRIVLSRRVFFVMLFCCLLVLAWVFSLGVLAGRGNIFESELFQKVEALLGLEHQEDIVPVAEVKVEPSDTKPQQPAKEPELTFYDTLNQKKPKPKRAVEGPLTKPVPPTRPVRLSAPKPPPEKPVKEKPLEIKPEPEAENKEIKPVEEEKTAVKTVKEKSVAPPPMRAPGENFTVQVAAAINIPDAEKAVRELRRKGFDAYYYQVELKGKQYFRVRVGRFESIEQARITKARLLADGHEGVFISKLQD